MDSRFRGNASVHLWLERVDAVLQRHDDKSQNLGALASWRF